MGAYIVVQCEHVDSDNRACEDNFAWQPEESEGAELTLTDGGGELRADFKLTDGWGIGYDRGAPRIRCPEHMPKSEDARLWRCEKCGLEYTSDIGTCGSLHPPCDGTVHRVEVAA